MRQDRNPLIRWLIAFRDDCRGAVLVWMVGAIAAVIAVSTLAVDMSHIYVVRNQLQISADAAALAGATAISDVTDMRFEAKKYAQLNMPEVSNILADADIQRGHWDHDSRTFTAGGAPQNAVKVIARMSQGSGNAAETYFARVFGVDDVDVTTSAVAAYSTDDEWNVIVVQDVTSSFSAEIADAREGNHALLDCLQQRTSGDSLVGMVTFTGVANNYQPLEEMEMGYDTLSDAIDGLAPCGSVDGDDDDSNDMPACSGTHVGAGMERANDMLDATPMTGKQAMVIMGDGSPNAKGPNAGLTNEQLREMARQQADRAEASGISVYTVFYDESDNDSAAAFFEDLTRGDGTALRTPDSGSLPELFESLCARLPLSLVE